MYKLIAFILVLASTQITAQPLNTALKAIGSGQVEQAAKYFNSEVEVTINNDINFLSKAETVATLKKFFASNPPQSFEEMHKGASKTNDSRYVIGRMEAGGKTFRIYLYGSEDSGQMMIQEIRIERE